MQFDSQFASVESIAYLSSQHIRYDTTPPHEHQFNGRIERANRTIQDRVQTAMQQSSARILSLWGFAIGDSIFKNNIVPSKGSNISPYHLWHRKAFDIQRQPLLPFGCAVMAHIAVETQSKLSANAELTYYVGPASTTKYAIMLYNKATKKTIIRRTFRVVPQVEDDVSPKILYESPYDYIDPIESKYDIPSYIDSSSTNLLSNSTYMPEIHPISSNPPSVVLDSPSSKLPSNLENFQTSTSFTSPTAAHNLSLPLHPPTSQFQQKTRLELSTSILDSFNDSEKSYSEKSLQPRGLRPRTHHPSYAKTKNPFVLESDSDSDEDGAISDHYDVALLAYQALPLPLPVSFTSTPSVASIYIPKSIRSIDRSQSIMSQIINWWSHLR
jgi:hypothetical protein